MRRIVFRSEHYRRYYFEAHAQLREGALNQFSPECGPWTNMCMSQHRRCAANSFLGDESFEFVRKANRQMAVVALMLFLTSIAGCVGTLEQSLDLSTEHLLETYSGCSSVTYLLVTHSASRSGLMTLARSLGSCAPRPRRSTCGLRSSARTHAVAGTRPVAGGLMPGFTTLD